MKKSMIPVALFMVITGVVLTTMLLTSNADERWYDEADVQQGNQLFQQHCAVCHKANAEGTEDWKKTDVNGKLPPPPLNGTAHAWHHDLESLRLSIREGGVKLGGTMPPFGSQLTEDEIDAVIAYFQSKWPDDLYHRWAERFLNSSASSGS